MTRPERYQAAKARFEPGKAYSYRETLGLLCSGQSSTAEYMLQDMLNSGWLVELQGQKYRVTQ